MSESPSFPVRFANFYVAAYAVDAVVSILVLGLAPDGAWPLLIAVQRAVASLVFAATLVMVPLLAVRPALPLGPLMGLVASVFWLATGAVPIPLWIPPHAGLPVALAILQAAFAAGIYLRFRAYNANTGAGWWLRDDSVIGGESEGDRMLRFSLLALGVGIPLALFYAVASLATWITVETQHFVSLDLAGIQLADRRYTNGDREIRLVGMMHLGEEDAYHAIAESFLGLDTIVLEEGVSDDHAVLEEAIQYDTLADSIGLSAQRSLASYLDAHYERDAVAVDSPLRPVLRNADIDSRSFAPATRRVLGYAARVWGDEDPLEAFVDLYRYLIENPADADAFFHDVIVVRNEHLIGELQGALLQAQRVIVPWGALHLPGIEAFVLDRGFVLRSESKRRVVSWSTLLAGITEP